MARDLSGSMAGLGLGETELELELSSAVVMAIDVGRTAIRPFSGDGNGSRYWVVM